MIVFDSMHSMEKVVTFLKQNSLIGTYDGTPRTWDYAEKCRVLHLPTGTTIMFTRDQGMHTCGWWKNPDYQQCEHLSLSFIDTIAGQRAPKNNEVTKQWIDLFFEDYRKWVWCEPPFSKPGKQMDVWHYRLFCNIGWDPILPRKEVYSKDYTPKGWKTWSEQGQPEMRGFE